MRKILFWCPFLTHVGTIKVINYASILNKRKKYKTLLYLPSVSGTTLMIN